MSAADSGLMIIAAPVAVTIGAVALAAAGISAAAENYRQFRFDKAFAREMERKAELDFAAGLSDANRQEYEAIMDERISEESSRMALEDMLQDSVRSRLRDEIRENARVAAQIHTKIAQIDKEVERYESEFGPSPSLREMADTIHRSREMFGDGKQLLQDLDDLLFVIIPGMTQEGREKQDTQRLEERLNALTSEHQPLRDTSEEFVSLHTGSEKKTADVRTPWERFMERVQAVAAVEEMYFETQAAGMMDEMRSLPAGRENFYIQQHEIELQEMEERAKEYKSRQRNLSQKTMEEYCLYLSMAQKMGIEPAYRKEDLFDAYVVQDMREDTEAMVEAFRKQRERQYTVNAITTVMKRHNLHFENMTSDAYGLDHVEYSMDEQAGVRITRAESGAFEMQFQGHSKGASASMDEQRSITEKAKHFCSLLPSITKELEEEFGISFEQTYLQPPSIENIEISQRRTQARQERARAQKAMQMK